VITTADLYTAWRSATDPKVVTVRTADPAHTPVSTLPFTVSILC